ncbi:MAG: hypothetical protein ACHQ50_13530 [Fimbriimonadales bacterium]
MIELVGPSRQLHTGADQLLGAGRRTYHDLRGDTRRLRAVVDRFVNPFSVGASLPP